MFDFEDLPDPESEPDAGGAGTPGTLFDFEDLPSDSEVQERAPAGGAAAAERTKAAGPGAGAAPDGRAQTEGPSRAPERDPAEGPPQATEAIRESIANFTPIFHPTKEGDEDPLFTFSKSIYIMQMAPGESEPQLCVVRDAITNLLEKGRKKVPASAPIFVHNDPDTPVRFGTWFGDRRAPVVFLEAPAPEVAEFIREDPDGPFAELETEVGSDYYESWGFTEDKKETMLKQDWHAFPHQFSNVSIFVPRLAASELLSRAPPRVMAFVVAFRIVNRACWEALADTLFGVQVTREEWWRLRYGEKALAIYKKTKGAKALDSLITCLRGHRHFGVVEAQVRWGEQPHRMPSHLDGATSLMHLSITLGGRRRLWAGTFEDGAASDNALPERPAGQKAPKELPDPEKDVYNEELWQPPRLQQFDMTKGCSYISSPFCFEHAVEYFACDQTDPVIALQCRFGFPTPLGKELNNFRSQEMVDISVVIAECLRTAGLSGLLRMPTLNEVVQADEQLRQQMETMLSHQ